MQTPLNAIKRSLSMLLGLALYTTVLTFTYALFGVCLLGPVHNKLLVIASTRSTSAVDSRSLLSADFYNAHSHFGAVVPCMQLLYYIGTGADSAGIIEQVMRHLHSGLAWVAPIYFVSYIILVRWLIPALATLVVVYIFTLQESKLNGLAMEVVEQFRLAWRVRGSLRIRRRV
jgi:hypothetical protein